MILQGQYVDFSSAEIHERVRGFLPVVVDLETSGLDCDKNAILEVAAIPISINEDKQLASVDIFHTFVQPFQGAEICADAFKTHGIDVSVENTDAISESDMLGQLSKFVRSYVKKFQCQRAIIVGHNSFFDRAFLSASMKRSGYKKDPFHPFTTIDTASLSALAYGQTVLSKSCQQAGLDYCVKSAHSAIYDAQITADLFCSIFNSRDRSARC